MAEVKGAFGYDVPVEYQYDVHNMCHLQCPDTCKHVNFYLPQKYVKGKSMLTPVLTKKIIYIDNLLV